MNKNIEKWFWRAGIIIVALSLISLFIAMFSMIDLGPSFRIVFGSVYVLFLPGFILSYIFFKETHERGKQNKTKGSIDWIERIALSFGLSIAIVPLVVFYLNLIGVAINLVNSFLTVLGIIILCIGILIYKNKKKKK